MDRKKIVILMLHLQFGGIEKQTITFANELAKKYDVQIVSTYSMKKEPAYQVSKNINIKYLIDDKPNRNEFKLAIKKGNIVKIIKESVKALRILFLKKYLMIKEIKNTKSDFIFSTRMEFANMISKHAPKNVVTITEEHLHDDSAKYVRYIKKSCKNLDYLITIGVGSTINYSKWLEENKKIKIIEIPNMLEDVPHESARLETFNLVAVGRLHPVKDFGTLIRMFDLVQKNIVEAKLTIVGGGEEQKKLAEIIKTLNIQDKVVITGMVDKEAVQMYMREADIYVMTSVTECFPMVLLEASSVGLPLVAFDVPVGPQAIIKNDENGFLVENRNVQEMAEVIVSLLKDREKLKEMGRKAKEMSYQYLPQNVMGKWYEIFDKTSN